MLNRRSFLTYFSLGWLTSCFPVVLAACAPKSGNTEAATPDKGGEKPVEKPVEKSVASLPKTADGLSIVGTVADLDKTGELHTPQVSVARDPANPKQLLAVNPKCTHKGCIVNWVAAEKRYECPCHDSDFAADGKVLKGPATTALATYPAKIVGTQVLVKL